MSIKDEELQFYYSQKHRNQNTKLGIPPVYAIVTHIGLLYRKEYTFCDVVGKNIYTSAYQLFWDDTEFVGIGTIEP